MRAPITRSPYCSYTHWAVSCVALPIPHTRDNQARHIRADRIAGNGIASGRRDVLPAGGRFVGLLGASPAARRKGQRQSQQKRESHRKQVETLRAYRLNNGDTPATRFVPYRPASE